MPYAHTVPSADLLTHTATLASATPTSATPTSATLTSATLTSATTLTLTSSKQPICRLPHTAHPPDQIAASCQERVRRVVDIREGPREAAPELQLEYTVTRQP
jgi:hypothetical protein